MSGLNDYVSDDSPVNDVIEWLSAWYHVLIVAGLFGFMVWLRARTWGRFLVDGKVLFSGNDPWYHLRQISYTVSHWPSTMPFDPWTEFPTGTFVGQFGTFMDQLVATAALVIGLGSPSDELVRLVALFSPVVFGAAIVVPTYYLGKRMGGRLGGVIAALVLALSAGELLQRSLVGFADHQVVEALFQALAVLGILIAVRVAQEEKPVYELFVDRDWAALRRPLGWATLAGAGLGLYLWTWPPAILLIGILGVYVTIQLPVAYLRGESPEHVGIATATIFSVAGVLSLVSITSFDLNMVQLSLAQPALAFAGVAWSLGLAWLAREWDRRHLASWQYPATVFGGLVVGAVLLAVLLPDLFWYFFDQLLRFVGFTVNPTASASTVGEVQPLTTIDPLWQWFGAAPFVAVAGVGIAIAHQYLSDELKPELLFVALWFVFMVAATFTQQRFAYYLTVPTATLTALVVTWLFGYLRSAADSSDLETYQVLTILSVVVAVVLPMVVVYPTAIDVSGQNGPGGVSGWESSLEWMSENTPAVGNYGGAGNAEDLDFYGTYERTDDYEYPDGAYGVMSWWDYGHWITQEGERIPVANPFQGNADKAARFLIAQNESEAAGALDVVSENETDAQTRYAMIDWKMATANGAFGGKYFAPPNFLDTVSESTYYRKVRGLVSTEEQSSITSQYYTVQKQAYYESMSARLYRYHGSAASPENVPGVSTQGRIPVVDWEETPVTLSDGTETTWNVPARNENGSAQALRWFDNRTAAEAYVAEDGTAQIGGLGKIPAEEVPALEHYRLVHVSNQSQNSFTASQPGLLWFAQQNAQNQQVQYQSGVGVRDLLGGTFSEPNSAWTKTFERVPGATVEGTGPANTNVTASVEMEMPNANGTFTYRQHAQTDADGEFTMTLPYSTTDYDAVSTEDGYTNVSVRANGSYEFRTPSTTHSTNESVTVTAYTDTADVSDEQVVGTDESVVEVNLTESVLFEQDLNSSDDSTNETGENTTDGTETSDTDGGSTGETDENTTESLAPAIAVGDAPIARAAPTGY
ncbi:Transmembrane oligosaccharyl transferase protein [Halorhabdus tiamatea SARL4B]|uniref:dolichyl-phosphooligosaccharide-protein glycotransferase n=1 Tax=Halorhabdus tiamatea SARL4B TaxID=1033806 RepID=F7PIH4_9EURY|nr:oligosaccharyl transferase, archaeosortase A system-associated [Halorhabdus tiamatea]ERJ07052.1 Transmembrane oligosaccharyl transferase protein [Halorhabdus tiamatea SARL4B]CCQ34818.1 transmembrane oligosaccharyl transferase [Halorhabdus tiamatea SARL4B]